MMMEADGGDRLEIGEVPWVRFGEEVYVWWPLGDPAAEELVPLKDLAAFAMAQGVVFERFCKARRWH